MITSLYGKYFQKSKTFLFPVLGLKRTGDFHPVQTYISWKGRYTLSERKLICVYEKTDTEEFKAFEQKMLHENPLFECLRVTKDNHGIYVFNLDHFNKDWDHFIKGKYSLFSKVLKKAIQDYYGADSAEYKYLDTFLHPQEYFGLYARLLNIDESILKVVGELCDPYDSQKEELSVEEKDLENLENSTYICRP